MCDDDTMCDNDDVTNDPDDAWTHVLTSWTTTMATSLQIGRLFAYFLISFFALHSPSLSVIAAGALFQIFIASLMQVLRTMSDLPTSYSLPFVHALVDTVSDLGNCCLTRSG